MLGSWCQLLKHAANGNLESLLAKLGPICRREREKIHYTQQQQWWTACYSSQYANNAKLLRIQQMLTYYTNHSCYTKGNFQGRQLFYVEGENNQLNSAAASSSFNGLLPILVCIAAFQCLQWTGKYMRLKLEDATKLAPAILPASQHRT